MACRRVINAGYGRSRVAVPVQRRMAQQRPDTGATRSVLLKTVRYYFFFFTTFHFPPSAVSVKETLNLLLFQWVKPNNRRALRLLFALIMISLLWLAKVDAAPCSRQAPDAFIQGVSYLTRI